MRAGGLFTIYTAPFSRFNLGIRRLSLVVPFALTGYAGASIALAKDLAVEEWRKSSAFAIVSAVATSASVIMFFKVRHAVYRIQVPRDCYKITRDTRVTFEQLNVFGNPRQMTLPLYDLCFVPKFGVSHVVTAAGPHIGRSVLIQLDEPRMKPKPLPEDGKALLLWHQLCDVVYPAATILAARNSSHGGQAIWKAF